MKPVTNTPKSVWPALTLMIMAPLITEVLPGATRYSSIFVFPIEMCVWGGGALLIRYAVRRWQLGWLNMLLLALALSIAEEWLIQQTSLAPMVIRLKGVTYARVFGINYVYFLWALIHESVFVVFLPVYLVELIFPSRREGLWLSKAGIVIFMILFVLGSYLAWYSWTQIARPKVFHVPAFNPPLSYVIIALALIALLLFLALGSSKYRVTHSPRTLEPVNPWIIGIAGALWATVLYGIVILAFGEWPAFPPMACISVGLVLMIVAFLLVPRWSAAQGWRNIHLFGLISGTMTGSMLVGFVGFIGSTGPDLYFKVITNIIAMLLLIVLGFKVSQRNHQELKVN